MKRFLVVLTGLLLSVSLNAVFAVDARQLEESRRYEASLKHKNPNDSVVAQSNRHVYRNNYVPTDLVETSYEGFNCSLDGYKVDNSQGYFCRDMKSVSQGSAWRVRHAFKYPGSPIEHVFKLTNGQPTLWVHYNPGNQRVEYASAGARQYAASHGGDTAVAAAHQPNQGQQAARGDQCDHLSGKMRAGCEAASGSELVPNISGLLKW